MTMLVTMFIKSWFYCPEEGCLKSYQRYSSLERHLDVGNHKYHLEHHTLYDKSMAIYASKLEQGTFWMTTTHPHSTVKNDATPVLTMGWALKSTGKKKRFTETQR